MSSLFSCFQRFCGVLPGTAGRLAELAAVSAAECGIIPEAAGAGCLQNGGSSGNLLTRESEALARQIGVDGIARLGAEAAHHVVLADIEPGSQIVDGDRFRRVLGKILHDGRDLFIGRKALHGLRLRVHGAAQENEQLRQKRLRQQFLSEARLCGGALQCEERAAQGLPSLLRAQDEAEAGRSECEAAVERTVRRTRAGEIIRRQIEVKSPKLWSPDAPYLYKVQSRIKKGNQSIDGGITRIGIRLAEFRGKDGFWLNGKPFVQLVGANRHQDFAYVGNALPNSQQWRDAKRLRDAGCTIIRVAHYPQDPSFMDACDELGMFVIVATPGWQYWNKDVKFGELVHQNTREMIRRDRNHPSVLMWEPILNETRYPLDFALKALEITKEEFPYPGRPVAAADVHSAGVKEHYDVVYGWPGDDEKADKPEQCIFTREFGENVDDWYAHNNNNRASRSWGERPLLIQALSLAKSYDEMYRTTGQFIGGTQWHPFDHQRGYHPDPYWGGIYDAFRQKKYAYEMFRSQSPASLRHPLAECGPMVFIAHEMSQFSDKDVVIFSNCDSIRLSIYDGTKSWTQPVVHAKGHMPNAPVVFENVWDFWEARGYSYTQKNWQKVNMVAEGIINGKVVCTQKKMPSRRSTKLRLYADTQKVNLVADGSDFIVIVAEVTDDSGNVRRLAKENIVFTVEGEGQIIGDATIEIGRAHV